MNRTSRRILSTALATLLASPLAFANDPQTPATPRTANDTPMQTDAQRANDPQLANDPQTRANPDRMNEGGHDSNQPVTDTWITTKVKSTLLATDGVAGTDINVTTIDGVVTLAGVLDTQAAVDRAIEVTRGIEGVVSVDTRALKTR